MAKTTITNAYVQIVNNDASGNTFDLSDHVQSVTLKYSRETPENTSMGATSKGRLSGLQDCTVTLNLYQVNALFVSSDIRMCAYVFVCLNFVQRA